MRILRVIASMDPASGGPCQGIRNITPALSKLGIETEVLAFDTNADSFRLKDDFLVHFIGPTRTPYAFTFRLKRWLHSNIDKFDVIIIHGLWLYNSYGTYNVWKKQKRRGKKIKLFVMPHGMLDPYFQKDPSRRLKAIRNKIFWQLFESRVVNNADAVLYTCEQEMLLARKCFSKYSPNQELNISYGVPLSQNRDISPVVLAKKLNQWDKKPFILYLGRIHHKKGVDILIDAYLKLEKVINDLPQLIIAGPGENGVYGKALIEKASLSKRIFFTGMLVGEAKIAAFSYCESFILPSHQENFGIAIVEALSFGKPVLISNKVNIWREVENAGAGIVENDDERGVYTLLYTWVNKNLFERSNMAVSAKKVYTERFSIDVVANNFVHQINPDAQ